MLHCGIDGMRRAGGDRGAPGKLPSMQQPAAFKAPQWPLFALDQMSRAAYATICHGISVTLAGTKSA
jgi:hypothetical protein